MKRLGLFIATLLLVTTALYLEPVVFPPKLETSTQDQQLMGNQNQVTSWKYQELSATGFSTYIGQPVTKLESAIGSPKDRLTSGFGFEIRYYQDPINQIVLEANIQNDQVEAIKVLNANATSLAPFSVGMTMQDLTEITTIFPNFTFEYEDTEVGIELTEEDMNYRPLIAFDNGTFAMLFFDQDTGGLFSTVYLNKKSLLKLMPYQVFGEGLPQYQVDESADWESINQSRERVVTRLLTRLRHEAELPDYYHSPEFMIQTDVLLTDFLNKPEEWLADNRLAEWEMASQTAQTTVRFTLSNDEINRLVEKRQLDQTTGIFMHPIIDPTFSFLLLYTDPYYHDRFLDKEPTQLGVAFSKENMLVLMQEKEETSESSDNQ
ncbi:MULTISPECIES: CAP-associated domain-containing protein [unclassified Enterococcus]|uniref:CAP-associated domain-containing protein n=1 Tax=unclassified Enterococcus TaxID=2608891 RepID=UPI001A9B19A8|nr:CAP-associated domain-containing protein [Enterococcus sp. DIV1271a]MBO1298750.1 hypothetical protein [Enterococcus sp. DIV1271a]